MSGDDMEKGFKLFQFSAERVARATKQRMQLLRQLQESGAPATAEGAPQEPTTDAVKQFALELEKETRNCDPQAALAMQSRLMLPDKVGGKSKELEDFKRALLNITELDPDIYCRAIALAFLQLVPKQTATARTENPLPLHGEPDHDMLFAGVDRKLVEQMRDKANGILRLQKGAHAQSYGMAEKIIATVDSTTNLNELIPLLQNIPAQPTTDGGYSDDDVALAFAFLSLSEPT